MQSVIVSVAQLQFVERAAQHNAIPAPNNPVPMTGVGHGDSQAVCNAPPSHEPGLLFIKVGEQYIALHMHDAATNTIGPAAVIHEPGTGRCQFVFVSVADGAAHQLPDAAVKLVERLGWREYASLAGKGIVAATGWAMFRASWCRARR